jgi:hypothetical protein
MKRAAIILLCAFALAAQGQWKRAGQTREATFYLRNERPQETDDGTLLAWDKQLLRDDTPEGRKARAERVENLTKAGKDGEGYAYTLTLSEYDCRRGQTRPHKMIDYDSAGRVIVETGEDGLKGAGAFKWESPPPGTMEEAIMRKVCLTPSELH